MTFIKIIVLIFFFIFGLTHPAAQAFNPKTDALPPYTLASLKQLIQTSDIIGYGKIDGVKQQFKTPISVSHGKLVNTVQPFQIIQPFKGAKHSINIMVTGVEPLPRPSDPLNQLYPGPLASGSYILFLKKITGLNDYQLSGGWQGVYPILNGKSIALYGIGFKDLDQLTVEEFFQKLNPSLPHRINPK